MAMHQYSYIDASPFCGTTYYRLKQIDFDGDYHYSNMTSVYNGNYIVTAVDVYSVDGRLIMTYKDNGNNDELKNLSYGAYVLHYHTSKGIVVKKVLCESSREPIVMGY
jgi:hypothetical protein